MDFELSDEQRELRDTARSVLASACPRSLVRAVHEGTGDGSELWSTLVALDWPALGLPEQHGGLGLGYLDVAIVVQELGRAVAPAPLLATVTQFVPLVREAGSSFRLPDVAAGGCTGTLALAEGGVWRLDTVRATARRSSRGWVLDGVKSHVLDGTTADELAVVARGDGGPGVFAVPGPARRGMDTAAQAGPGSAVSALPRSVIDPTWPIATIVLDGVEVGDERVLVEPGDRCAPRVVERALHEATTAIALSTVATCRAIFETTLGYAKDREQFGRPIGSFQALKHRLADCYLAVERAESLAWFAALTIAEDDDRRAMAAAMAKAAAGECQRLLARDGLQLHGGVGFTWENDLHFLLKRAKTGDLLFGTAATQRAELARMLGLEAA